MEYTNKAIEGAIERGWVLNKLVGQMNYSMVWVVTPFGKSLQCSDDTGGVYFLDIDNAFLDPLFWQCLGKAEGWSEDEYFTTFGSEHPILATKYGGNAYTVNTWRYHWHGFINYLAVNGLAEDFFKNLLK